LQLETGATAALVRAFPVLRRLPGFTDVAASVDEKWQEGVARVSVAARALFAEVARQQPLVVVIDDLQWADRDTIALVRALLDPPAGVLLVFAARDRVELDPRAVVRTIAIAPLSLEATATLVEQELGAVTSTIDRHAIARASRGDPLFASALARYAATTGELASRFQDAVRQTVLRGGALAVKIAELVCVAHAPLAVTVASRTLGSSGTAFFEAVATLRAGQVLASSGVASAMQLEPYHDRVRNVLTASLTPEARRRLHHAIATTLEASPSADAASLGLHWQEAGEPTRAARHATRAAEQAEASLAFHRAADLYRWAGELAPEPTHARAKHAECLGYAGRGVEAADAYLACAADADGVAAINLRRLAMQQLLLVGNVDRSLELLNKLMQELDLPNPTKPRKVVVGIVLRRLRQLLRKLKFEARALDEVAPVNGARIDVVWDAASGLTLIDPLRAFYFQSLNIDLAQRFGDDVRVARALLGEVPLLAASGRVSRRLERVFTLCDEVSQRLRVTAFPPLVRGYASFFLGRWQHAVTNLGEAEAMLVKERPPYVKEMYGPSQIFGLPRRFIVACMYYLGRLRELERVLPELLRDAVERNDIAAATYFRAGVQCLGYLALGDVDTARRNVDDALGPWQSSRGRVPHFMDLNARTAIDIYEGRGSTTWDRVRATWPDFEASRLMRAQYPRVSLLDIRGRTALAAAAAAAAPERKALLADATRCATRLRAERAVWSVPLGDSLVGGVALLAGDEAAAQRHLERAATGFAAADMVLYAANARLVRATLAGDREAAETERTVMTTAGVSDLDRYSQVLLPRA